ncbi:MAG: SDR family oxidoreductase [Vicinamibacterales bacterium]
MTARLRPFDLSGRTVLITGGSSEIGRETARVVSELGARVIVSGRHPGQLEETLTCLAPGAHAIEPFDLTDLEALPEWVRGLARRYGPFNGLLHAAGVQTTIGVRGLSVEVLHRTFRVNLDAAVMLAKGFRQKGCCTPSSSLVFISSMAAIVGSPAMAAYAASKAALIGLARSLAIELAREGIRVNCVAPGLIASGMGDQLRQTVGNQRFAELIAQTPLGAGTAADIAHAAGYLLSDASRWVTGHTLVVDGGFTAQ